MAMQRKNNTSDEWEERCTTSFAYDLFVAPPDLNMGNTLERDNSWQSLIQYDLLGYHPVLRNKRPLRGP